MADQDKHDKTSKEYEEMETTHNGELLKELFQSIDITIEKNNTSVNDLTALTSSVALNTAKTGITTAQASAIAANTAKTGITTTQAQQITTLSAGRVSNVRTNINKVTAQLTQTVEVNSKTGDAAIITNVLLSNGQRYIMSEALTKQKGK